LARQIVDDVYRDELPNGMFVTLSGWPDIDRIYIPNMRGAAFHTSSRPTASDLLRPLPNQHVYMRDIAAESTSANVGTRFVGRIMEAKPVRFAPCCVQSPKWQ
jgi:hypothetical protein